MRRFRLALPLVLAVAGVLVTQAAPVAAHTAPVGGGTVAWVLNRAVCFDDGMFAHARIASRGVVGVDRLRIRLTLETYVGHTWRAEEFVTRRFAFTGPVGHFGLSHRFTYEGAEKNHPTLIHADYFWSHDGVLRHHETDQTGVCNT